ncbi:MULTISPECIES: hypothetical protein [Nocardia]|uniref:hypothetical protein n=1 Tax=Nocardia TaxID=1817 RepID=UPI0024568870|nr:MULTISPECIES: hypothetical protein [Nocardia]
MTLIRIYVRSDGAELDVREEETVSLKSEPEPARLARIMRRVLGKVERAYGFQLAEHPAPSEDTIEVRRGDGEIVDVIRGDGETIPAPAPPPGRLLKFPAPTSWRGSGEPSWEVHADWRDTTASISPTATINRDDSDIPTIGIYLRDGFSKWTYPEARALALAILAATEWKEEDDTSV